MKTHPGIPQIQAGLAPQAPIFCLPGATHTSVYRQARTA